VDELVVSTVVYESPETVYDFLLDFPRYGRYSEYLEGVTTLTGDGGPGTKYELRFAWWKLTYTTRSAVTGVDRPNRIDWRVIKDIDAHGCWRVEPIDDPARAADGGDTDEAGEADDGADEVCEVAFEVRFDPGSADSGVLNLPRFVSMDWVLKKTIPLIRDEAERVVERAVADLEGDRRSIDLTVRTDSERL